MKTHFFAIIGALLLFSLPVGAYNESNQEIENRLRRELATVKTPKDSIKILYDIFDIASRSEYRNLAKEIYGTAKRAGDVETQLDILRQVTAVIKEDGEYDMIMDEIKRIPESDEQKETMLFIEMKKVSFKSRNMSEEDRQKEITQLISDLESKKQLDKYSKLLLLFKVVEYLRNDTSGDILEQYIDMLVDMSESDDFTLYVIPNVVYSEATNIYTSAGDRKKAVKADEKLLEVIDGLEKKYAAMDRKYRNYDVNRFICYRRMLRNFEGLEPGQAQQIYSKILELRKSNWDVAKDIDTNPYTYAYYYMAIGAYAQAIPYLKLLFEADPAVTTRKQVLELLLKAADKTDDKATKQWAQQEYNRIENEYERLNAAENYKTLQILYEVKALHERNTALELENREKDLKTARAIMIVVIVAFLLLAVAFFISLYHWGRHKKNSHKLTVIAKHMTQERNRIRHRLFCDTDDEEEENRTDERLWQRLMARARKSGTDIATLMVQIIINDLLHIAMLGKGNRDKHIHKVSVDTIMRRAASLAMERDNNGHVLSVSYPEDDFKINTDRDCLAIVVGHLLHGTAINTPPESRVSLHYEHSDGKMKFIFTDEGYYNVGDDSAVFDEMLSIDEMVKMSDSGMTVDRLIALLLASDVKYDRTYTQGTRFIFITPDDLMTSNS